jgi:hypothetical protein
VRNEKSWQKAADLTDQGEKFLDNHEDDEAARCFATALEACDEYEPAWFNMGLVLKRSRRWADAAECYEQSIELAGEPGDPAWWNLGIAATALRDWPTARRAWAGYGIEIPPGDGELRMEMDTVPIRVGGDSLKEVNWCDRIDPARGIIMNVPHPATGRSWRDIILHDGAPNGEREVDGHVVPVFDELEVWEPSNIPTTMFEIELTEPEDAAALKELFTEEDLAAEDFTTNSRILCRECSEGHPPPGHDHAAEPPPTTRCSEWRVPSSHPLPS